LGLLPIIKAQALATIAKKLQRAIDNLVTDINQLGITRIISLPPIVAIHSVFLDSKQKGMLNNSLLKQLSQTETKVLSTSSPPWKSAEFTIGRILLKRCVADIHKRSIESGFLQNISIIHDQQNRPVLDWDSKTSTLNTSLSLSHKQSAFIAACSSLDTIGVDLEDLCVSHPGVLRTRNGIPETEVLEKLPDLLTSQLAKENVGTVVWSAREAAFKAFSIHGAHKPFDVTLAVHEDSVIATLSDKQKTSKKTVYIFEASNYVFCLAL
jgi:phosphopantetheinyl transferase (holo-ACP synthase)